MNIHMKRLTPAFLMRSLFKEQHRLRFKTKICRRCFSSSYSGPVLEEVPESARVFKPKRVAVLSKMTRYEFEKKRCKTFTEHELKSYLESKRSDYYGLLERHEVHYNSVELIRKCLEDNGIETRVVDRFHYDNETIDWADIILSAGGDGTFLLAASRIRDRNKPLLGINTDPQRSEGHLCIQKEYHTLSGFRKAVKNLLLGDFSWKWRHRIRITVAGIHECDESVELHDQQLLYPEHRFTEHVQELETCRNHVQVTGEEKRKILPVLALNEVFVGESLSSRVSYYNISIDDNPWTKQKSSGVTVCTGTGSSSWHFNINHLPTESVAEILNIANDCTGCNFPVANEEMVQEVARTFNSSLRFDSAEFRMAFTVRDPVINGIFHVPHPKGFAQKIEIRSRMWDACLVVDGGTSFKFNDGAVAKFELFDEDALRTLTFN
ncbi:hypothetical protein ScPMuIL_005577 [Solemya velum]